MSAPRGEKHAARAPAARERAPELRTAELLARRHGPALAELYAFWRDSRPGPSSAGSGEPEMRASVAGWMADPELADARVRALGRRLGAVIDCLLAAPGLALTRGELARAGPLVHLSDQELEAALQALERRAVCAPVGSDATALNGARAVGLPVELAEALLRQRRARRSGLFDLLTLRGHLDRLVEEGERGNGGRAQRSREMYKLYAREAASVARVERLPEGLRRLVQRAILEFGGLLPRHLFERMDTELPHWSGRRWQLVLERSLVGTVAQLELERFGVLHSDETLIVFNEVALAWLRRVAVPSDPDGPHDESRMGIDQVSNLSRFLAFLGENDVRFTLRGEIFKTTERKILQQLIPDPGRELSREEVLSFLYGFARHAGLLERTGERTLAVSSRGRTWAERPLVAKLQSLLDYALEEHAGPGESWHQGRLRLLLLRLLKRVEPGTWYDLMYLPFLARNNHLAALDELRLRDGLADKSGAATTGTLEDPQRLAWNLVKWVRQRLFLLGIVDLGYDRARRPVAMRLTRVGARLLGARPDAPFAHGADRGLGSLVVTPDFEVVLFPTGDDADVVHDLDRFCQRESSDAVVRFRITEPGVRRALASGMYLARILETLEAHSRTPLPQNVRVSILDWARRAGVMTLGLDYVLQCADSDTLRRFQQDPGTRSYVREVLGDHALRLQGRATPRRLVALLRELGYVAELA